MKSLERTKQWILVAGLVVLLGMSAAAQDWQVVSADYGAGGRRIDVTQQVQQLIANGYDFRVSNDALGGDPAPGQRKELVIHARSWKGLGRDFRYDEDNTVPVSMFGGNSGGGDWGNRRGMDLIEAQYGTHDRHVDVTPQVRQWIASRQTNIVVNNDNLGVGDPVPGRVKILTLFARERDDGDRRELRFQEGETADLSPFFERRGWGSDLRIVNGRYGAGNRSMDVTRRLQDKVSGGSLNLHVNNDTMGGDPAPGQAKTLYVTYQYGNQSLQSTTVPESGDLQLAPGGCRGPGCGGQNYRGLLSAEDQRRYDSYYSRWQGYLRDNNREEIESMENRMRGIMRDYKIPTDTPFQDLTSTGVGVR